MSQICSASCSETDCIGAAGTCPFEQVTVESVAVRVFSRQKMVTSGLQTGGTSERETDTHEAIKHMK